VDHRNFGGGIKAYSGTEMDHTARDLSRGKAEVKSMTSRSHCYFENATYLKRIWARRWPRWSWPGSARSKGCIR